SKHHVAAHAGHGGHVVTPPPQQQQAPAPPPPQQQQHHMASYATPAATAAAAAAHDLVAVPQCPELVCPLARMRRIIKLDPEVPNVTLEATHLISKAMELFTENLAKDANAVTVRQSHRTLKAEDVFDALYTSEKYAWLRDDFPRRGGG
ncbi:unnamed protein product, partial [Phaeothamnion confervicola]